MRIILTSTFLAAVALVLFISPASPTAYAEDVISGDWDLVINNQGNTAKLAVKLKLDGENVTGSFESSTPLGNGPVSGNWTNGKLAINVQTSHATLVMTGTMKNGKLAGDWETGSHMSGKWEATRKKSK
jgi:hypothetical protein